MALGGAENGSRSENCNSEDKKGSKGDGWLYYISESVAKMEIPDQYIYLWRKAAVNLKVVSRPIGGRDAAAHGILAHFGSGNQRASGGEMRQGLIWLVMAIAAVVPACGDPLFAIPAAASSFGMLGGTISNTGTSVVQGNVGAVTSITGFPPGTATGFVCTEPGGTGGGTCSGEQSLVTDAYNAIFATGGAFDTAEALTTTPGDTFATLPTGTTFDGNSVYTSSSDITTAAGITLNFDAGGDSSEVFVIQINGALQVGRWAII